jgi:chromate reductase, NAD(P)H dehydrogenase (quinone)
MDRQFTILGIAGSLRKASYNKAALRAAWELTPPGVIIDILDLEGIPVFNADQEATPPEIVKELKLKIMQADALLIVTPEYNYSIPGVLKNAIDWASRPPAENPFNDKPVAMMSASTGMLGGARAQYHLRQTFVFLNMHPLNKPEVFINFAPQKFDEAGRLIDEKAKEIIKQLLINLVEWARRLKGQILSLPTEVIRDSSLRDAGFPHSRE